MKLIIALAAALVALTTRRVEAEASCPAVKIIHATFSPPPTTTSTLAPTARRLEVDNVCVTSRAEHITENPFVDTGSDLVWQVRGDDLIEDNFERFAVDFVGHDDYWLTNGDPVPDSQKVLAITVDAATDFVPDWAVLEAVASTDACDDILLYGKNIAESLIDGTIWFVILPTTSVVHDSWTTWQSADWAAVSHPDFQECGSGCHLVVGPVKTGDLMNDVHAALQLVPHDSNPFASCVPQPFATTTTTTEEPTEPTTATTTTSPDESTTLLSSTSPTQPLTTDATTSGGRATVAMASVLPSLIVSTVGVAAVLF